MPFERFTKRLAVQAAPATVTIQRRGIFALNEPAYQALGAPEAVLFFFDQERQLVGLAAASATDEDAARVRTTKNNGTTHIITGARFANFYGIPTDQARRYRAEMRRDLLVIDLHDEEVGGPANVIDGGSP